MFSHLSRNINRKISFIIILLLLLYMLIIFFFYSSLLRKDYISKAEQISSKMAGHVELRLHLIENAISTSMQNHEISTATPNYATDLYPVFRTILVSNVDILNIFFYNFTEEIYYFSSQKSLYHDYIEACRSQYASEHHSDNWSLFYSDSNQKNQLLYSHAVYVDNTPVGYLVVEVDTDSLVKMIDVYKNSFIKETDIILSSSDENYLFLQPKSSDGKSVSPVSFSTEKEQQKISAAVYTSCHLLYPGNLSIQLQFSLEYVVKSSLFMIVILTVVLIVASSLCYLCISRYTAYISKRLTDLAVKLEHLPENKERS